MATHLVWLRTDLRIHDNLALAAACRDPQAHVLALYIATPGQWREHPSMTVTQLVKRVTAEKKPVFILFAMSLMSLLISRLNRKGSYG